MEHILLLETNDIASIQRYIATANQKMTVVLDLDKHQNFADKYLHLDGNKLFYLRHPETNKRDLIGILHVLAEINRSMYYYLDYNVSFTTHQANALTDTPPPIEIAPDKWPTELSYVKYNPLYKRAVLYQKIEIDI